MKTSTHMLAAACMLAMAACAHAPAEKAARPATDAPVAATSVELRQPRPGLYTAGQPAQGDWQAIAARGVTTVVNLRTPKEMEGRDEAVEVQAAGMRYVSIPVAGADGITEANARLLRDALGAADGPVLVHCASGNRVGGLLTVMAARDESVPVAQALDLGRAAGMTSTEARVRQVLEAPVCTTGTTASGVPEGCP